MATEIERKYLTVSEVWRKGAKGTDYKQGYVAAGDADVRVGISGNEGYVSISGGGREYTYKIPKEDADELLERLCEAGAVTSAATVRVRTAGGEAYFTIKGPRDETGIGRDEFEYKIPHQDALGMHEGFCKTFVEKTRYRVPHGGLVWEVDEFHGANEGLIVAEVELPAADHPVSPPSWIGAEVSQDSRYNNSSLAKRPYSQWKQDNKKCQKPKP